MIFTLWNSCDYILHVYYVSRLTIYWVITVFKSFGEIPQLFNCLVSILLSCSLLFKYLWSFLLFFVSCELRRNPGIWVIHSNVVNDKIDKLILFWAHSESFGKMMFGKLQRIFWHNHSNACLKRSKVSYMTHLCYGAKRKIQFFSVFSKPK